MSSPTPPPDRDRPPSRQSSSSPDENELDFEQSLREVEQSLLMLKARYTQIQLDRQRQQELQQRLSQTQQQLKHDRSRALRAELKTIKQQIEELEVALESQLFSWTGLREVFWQAVRFGGVGVIVGWVLKSCAG